MQILASTGMYAWAAWPEWSTISATPTQESEYDLLCIADAKPLTLSSLELVEAADCGQKASFRPGRQQLTCNMRYVALMRHT